MRARCTIARAALMGATSALLLTTCRDDNRPTAPLAPAEPSGPSFATIANGQVLIGAGNISTCGKKISNNNDEATAKLLDANSGTVFAAGDNELPDGSSSGYNTCYNPTWGRHKAATRPTPGEIEYKSSGASGYFSYFGAAAGTAGQGYYSYDLGDWHVVVLNSGISTGAGSAPISAPAPDAARWLTGTTRDFSRAAPRAATARCSRCGTISTPPARKSCSTRTTRTTSASDRRPRTARRTRPSGSGNSSSARAAPDTIPSDRPPPTARSATARPTGCSKSRSVPTAPTRTRGNSSPSRARASPTRDRAAATMRLRPPRRRPRRPREASRSWARATSPTAARRETKPRRPCWTGSRGRCSRPATTFIPAARPAISRTATPRRGAARRRAPAPRPGSMTTTPPELPPISAISGAPPARRGRATTVTTWAPGTWWRSIRRSTSAPRRRSCNG